MVSITELYKNFKEFNFYLFDNKCNLLISYKNDSVKAVCENFNTKHFEEIKKKNVDDIKFDDSLYNIIVSCDSDSPQTYKFRVIELSNFPTE